MKVQGWKHLFSTAPVVFHLDCFLTKGILRQNVKLAKKVSKGSFFWELYPVFWIKLIPKGWLYSFVKLNISICSYSHELHFNVEYFGSPGEEGLLQDIFTFYMQSIFVRWPAFRTWQIAVKYRTFWIPLFHHSPDSVNTSRLIRRGL